MKRRLPKSWHRCLVGFGGKKKIGQGFFKFFFVLTPKNESSCVFLRSKCQNFLFFKKVRKKTNKRDRIVRKLGSPDRKLATMRLFWISLEVLILASLSAGTSPLTSYANFWNAELQPVETEEEFLAVKEYDSSVSDPRKPC